MSILSCTALFGDKQHQASMTAVIKHLRIATKTQWPLPFSPVRAKHQAARSPTPLDPDPTSLLQ